MKSNASPVAGNIPFDPSEKTDGTPITPFLAENIQDAIIEARNTVGNVSAFIDTIFPNDISIASTKVLILKDPIVDGNIIVNGELYLL